MEFSIKVLVVITLIIIAFVVFVAMIMAWGGESSNIIKSLSDWFGKVFTGQEKRPSSDLWNPAKGGESPSSEGRP